MEDVQLPGQLPGTSEQVTAQGTAPAMSQDEKLDFMFRIMSNNLLFRQGGFELALANAFQMPSVQKALEPLVQPLIVQAVKQYLDSAGGISLRELTQPTATGSKSNYKRAVQSDDLDVPREKQQRRDQLHRPDGGPSTRGGEDGGGNSSLDFEYVVDDRIEVRGLTERLEKVTAEDFQQRISRVRMHPALRASMELLCVKGVFSKGKPRSAMVVTFDPYFDHPNTSRHAAYVAARQALRKVADALSMPDSPSCTVAEVPTKEGYRYRFGLKAKAVFDSLQVAERFPRWVDGITLMAYAAKKTGKEDRQPEVVVDVEAEYDKLSPAAANATAGSSKEGAAVTK